MGRGCTSCASGTYNTNMTNAEECSACTECDDGEVAVVGCTASTDRVCVPAPDMLPGRQPNIVTSEGDVLLTPGTKRNGRTGVLFSAGDVVVNGQPLAGAMDE